MKIVSIASNPEILQVLKTILQVANSEDQFIFLQREKEDIRIDRIDLSSTNILILDSEKISSADLRQIAGFTQENVNPAVIYMGGSCTQEELISAMRSGVTEFIHIPVVSADLTAAIERIRGRKYMSSPHKPRGKIISFISCKGGSGNTFIAANLGYILAAEHQQKVLMIDLNLQFGDASFYISEEPGPSSLADIVRQAGLDSTVIATAAMQISENFYLLQAPDNAEDSMGIISTHVDNLLTIAAQDYDFVIVDLPRIIDSLAMKALDRADSIFIVMQPLVPYMRALTKMTSLLSKLGCDRNKIKIILNRFNENMDIPQENIADAVQSEIDFTISNDYLAVSKSVNIGKPLALLTHDNPVCSDLRKLATSLDGAVGESSPISFFKKLFGKR